MEKNESKKWLLRRLLLLVGFCLWVDYAYSQASTADEPYLKTSFGLSASATQLSLKSRTLFFESFSMASKPTAEIGAFIEVPVASYVSLRATASYGRASFLEELYRSSFFDYYTDVYMACAYTQLGVEASYYLGTSTKLKKYLGIGAAMFRVLDQESDVFVAVDQGDRIITSREPDSIQLPNAYWGPSLHLGTKFFYTQRHYIALELQASLLLQKEANQIIKPSFVLKANL